MALISEITTNSSESLFLWDISETTQELIHLYCADGSEAPAIQDPIRLRHFLASRLLVRSIFPNQILEKDRFGKPFIKGLSGGISLSHSENLAGLLVSPSGTCGLDLEVPNPRILRLAPRFCAPEELAFHAPDAQMEALHIIWGAKECMYKAYGRKEIDFRAQLRVDPFTIAEEGLLSGRLLLPSETQHFRIAYRFYLAYVLLWTVRESG